MSLGLDLRVAAAVEAIYGAAPEPSLWPEALQAIADCFGDVGAVLIWQRDDGSFGTIASPSLVEAQRDYQQNGWHRQDLLAIRSMERALWLKSDGITNSDLVTEEEMATHAFFTDFSLRHGLRHRAAIGVAPDQHVSVAVSIQRSHTKQPYTDQELVLAKQIGRHVEKALRLSINLFDTQRANLSLADALTRLGIGVLILDSNRRVIFSNPIADGLLGDGLSIHDERLMLDRPNTHSDFTRAIETILNAGTYPDTDVRPLVVDRVKSVTPLTLHMLPMRTSGSTFNDMFLTRARVIVLLRERKADEPADPSMVRDVLGLTLGEARIAALIGAGLSPRSAASKLGLTEESTRTALKRIFSKLGVSRQSELVALLSKLLLR